MPPEVSYSFDPYQMMGDYENASSFGDTPPSIDPNTGAVNGAAGYIASIPVQANATVLKAFPPTRSFGKRLDEMGMGMRSERSQRAAREYDKQKNLLDAMREHPMELPHRVGQGMVIAGEAFLLGRGLSAAVAAVPAIAAGAAFTGPAVAIGGQGAVNFGNAYNELREEGYPRGRATLRASGDAAVSTALDTLSMGLGRAIGRPIAKVGIEMADETLNEVGGGLLGRVPRRNYYKGEEVLPMPEGNVEPVPVAERNPNYVPAYAPRLGAGYRVPVRRNPVPDPFYIPGGAYWRNAETGEAYFAERPVVRQNMNPDRWIPNEQEALDYPFGW